MEEYAIVRNQKKLRSYQKNVVRFMKQHNRLFVFHKMGTGKTLTAVTVSQSYLQNRRGIRITKKPSDHDFLHRIFGRTRK